MTIFTRLAILGVVTSLLGACSDSSDSSPNDAGLALDDPTTDAVVETDGDGVAVAPPLVPTTDTPASGDTDGDVPVAGTPVADGTDVNAPVTDVPDSGANDGETTGTDAPVTDTPSVETPVAETPATETPTTETPATGTPDTDTPATETPATDTDVDGSDTTTDVAPDESIDPTTDATPDTSNPVDPAPVESETPATSTLPPSTTTDPETGDVALNEYTRTKTEALSLAGPSRTDGNRTDGVPTAPSGVTALLIADNWVEFGWVPSTDDGAIVAYDIYRDGQLVATVDDDEETNSKEEKRDWRTTTYIDCNFTKDIDCQTVGQPQAGSTHVYTVIAIDDEGNRSAQSAPGNITLNMIEGSAAPDPTAAGYSMTFEDDFIGTSLDRDKWRTSMPWGPETVVNGEKQYFVDVFSRQGAELGFNPFEVTDGTLKINGIRTPAELLASANNQPYLSGVITTRDRKNINYGYVEMRAKVPGGAGLLSTFYLLQPNGNHYEIDILEYDGREPDGATQNYHYNDGFRFADTGFAGLAHASPTMKLDTGVNLSADFHIYSVLWEPELVIWYIDGIEVRRMTGPRVSNADMNIVAQQVIGSNWIGDPSEVTFPVKYEIDYMRVWEK